MSGRDIHFKSQSASNFVPHFLQAISTTTLVARFKYTSLQHLSPTALRLIARGLARQSTWLIEAELWVGDSPRASDCLTRRGRGRGGDSEPRPRVPAGRILFTICTIDAQLDGD